MCSARIKNKNIKVTRKENEILIIHLKTMNFRMVLFLVKNLAIMVNYA